MMFGYRLFLNFAATEGIAHVQMQTELAFAQAIQTTLAPPVRYQNSGLEAYGSTRPSDAVGGDLIDLVESDGSVFAYVADVSGHGIPAGVLMGMVKTAMRQGLLFHQPLSDLLESINRVLPAVKEPSMYATMAGLRFSDPAKASTPLRGIYPCCNTGRRTKMLCSGRQSNFLWASSPILPLPRNAYRTRQGTFLP